MTKRGPKDQTHCPKCHRMYCEGYWGEGVCTADMFFGREPTAAGDAAAGYLRAWYEAHREGWWEHRKRRWELTSDNLMIGLMQEVSRIEEAWAAERRARGEAMRRTEE